MKLGVKKLSTAVRLALALGAVIAAGASSTVFAQDTGTQGASNQPAQKQPDQKKTTMLQTVVVTGTRLPSVNITSSSPITTVDAKQFKVTGTTSVDQLVNSMPQLNPYFDQFRNNGATGYPTADLRGLGTNRTLVLIDGQRVQAGSAFAVDLSQIPAALVKRVDILTGGASAVYGADAVAGVVNFVLNDDFEGVQFDYNLSGYQHDNRNKYMQSLENAKGFNAPNGNTGFDGKTSSVDAIFGGKFAEGRGHAMGWVTLQKTDGVLQGTRDYSACALNAAGTACGGSGTAPNPNFYVFDQNFINGGLSHYDTATNKYVPGIGQSYNYAPLNYYQRPDTRVNLGTSIKYHVSDAFEPYMDFMYTHRRSAIQVAQSGTFFGQTLSIDCAANAALVGSLCTDLAPTFGLDTTKPLIVYVGKRNVEGGPRITADTTDSYRAVFGAKGDINLNWSYNVAGVLGETNDTIVGTGDLLSDRIAPALMGCPAGSYAGCIPYNVWVPNGVTAAAAANLQGTSLNQTRTRLMDVNAYVSGDLGVSSPWADGDPITLAAGTEWRKENFNYTADSNSQAGNFAGAGGPSLPLGGQTSVRELYGEAGVPLVENVGMLKSFGLDLGYRYSKYKLSGGANTFKIGFNSNFNDLVRFRGGFNRAVRAPNISELFSTNQIALYSGTDPCAGPTPADTAAQCLNTGVTAAQYGHVPDSPAGQYNQYIGGNQNLKPEKADTYTFGVAVTPIQDLEASLDFYDIKIQDTITAIGASTIVDLCAKTGNPFLCGNVKRNPATGDLWLGQTGKVINLTNNFGNLETRGIDLNVSYKWSMFGGHAYATLVGTDLLNYKVDPLPGVNSSAKYDCAGKISPGLACDNPRWRHIVNLGYSRDWWSVNVRWRHFGALHYVNTDGTALTTDHLLRTSGQIGAYNWLDLSGTFKLGSRVSWTVGVNNVTDRQPPLVGSSLVANANTPGGYDELGRYFFTNISMKL